MNWKAFPIMAGAMLLAVLMGLVWIVTWPFASINRWCSLQLGGN